MFGGWLSFSLLGCINWEYPLKLQITLFFFRLYHIPVYHKPMYKMPSSPAPNPGFQPDRPPVESHNGWFLATTLFFYKSISPDICINIILIHILHRWKKWLYIPNDIPKIGCIPNNGCISPKMMPFGIVISYSFGCPKWHPVIDDIHVLDHIHPSEWKADPPHTYKVDIFLRRKKIQPKNIQKYGFMFFIPGHICFICGHHQKISLLTPFMWSFPRLVVPPKHPILDDHVNIEIYGGLGIPHD